MDSEPGCQETLHHPVQLVSHALEFSLDLQDSLSLPGLAGLHFFPLPDFTILDFANYFLDPPSLVKSAYCLVSKTKLETALVKLAQERVFLDVANLVISSIREDQKMTWVQHFTNPTDLVSREKAVERLISQEAFVRRSEQVSAMLSQGELTERFEERLAFMTGGREMLIYRKGRWIEMISGKKVLPQLLNSGGFKVKDANGGTLTGEEMEKEIVKELAVKNVDSRPRDLGTLQQLIQNLVNST